MPRSQSALLETDKQIQTDLITDLCSLTAAGYTLAAVHTIPDNSSVSGVNPAKLACESLHRAMVLSGQQILVDYILYQPVDLNGWAGLHQLYSLSERQQLAKLPVEDALRETRSNIAQEYLPALLLACSKPNQLRQHDITSAYRAFQEWRDLAELQDPELGEGLFAVDMLSDQAPAFSELLVRRGRTQFRYINTKALVSHLEELKKSRGTQGLSVIEFDRETRLDANLLGHLIKSLGEISQRNFARQQSRVSLELATGLSNVHYFVAGQRSLNEVFRGLEYDESEESTDGLNPFITPASHGDAWQEANPEDEVEEHASDQEIDLGVDVDKFSKLAQEQDAQAQAVKPVRHTVFSVKTTNTSPGGYCVEWIDPPDSVHIGDIVCVRESSMEQADWTIAVIRWISQVKHAPTFLGLELISPRGAAYAARIKMPNGEFSKPIRVLLLPEIPVVGQAHTLVVPRMVFKEGQRITVTCEEDSSLVKLKRQVSSTGYFGQMDFEYIRQLEDDIENSKKEDLPTAAFDSIWTDI